MKVGDKKKFNHPQAGVWECKQIKEKPNLSLDWTWEITECPHCGEKITHTKTYKLERIYVWKQGSKTMYMADTEPVTKDGKGLHMRLPDKSFCSDKDMTKKIKEKL